MEARQYSAALKHLRLALDREADPAYVWLDIGQCHEKLKRWKLALEAYDKAIGDGGWWPPYRHKAHCLRRHKGIDAAVAWLLTLEKQHPGDRKYPYLVGSFCQECNLPGRAIPHFKRAIEMACKAQGFTFDKEGWLILDKETLAKENNDFCTLWPTLEYVADCCYATKDFAAAFRYATMGVSIGQQLNRCKGYYNKVEVQAGDADCRLIRARIFLRRGRWDEARKEIRFARVMADRSGYTGWIDQVRSLEKWMEENKSPRK